MLNPKITEKLRGFSNFGAIFQVTSVSLNSAISSTAFLAPLAIASWQQPLQLFGGFSDATLRRDVISYSAIVSATTALSAPWPVAVELNQMRMQSLEGNLVSTNGLMAAVRCWVLVSDMFQTCFSWGRPSSHFN